MPELALALIAFVGSHELLSHVLRKPLVAKLGEGGFAALYSVAAPVDTLVRVAQSFSPRVEVMGRLVLCDLTGVERLFGGARDVADDV